MHNAKGYIPISLSNGVSIGVTDVIDTGMGTSYVLVAKHAQGDTAFGIDSDSTAVYRGIQTAEGALADTDVPTAVEDEIELDGEVGNHTFVKM
jgi:hypothetical protein